MKLTDEADVARAIEALCRRIEKLSDGAPQFSRSASTGRFKEQLTTFVQFVNGKRIEEFSPERGDELPGPWRGGGKELLDTTYAAVEEYALTVPRPRLLTWRIYPEVQMVRGGPRLYLRLAFETEPDPTPEAADKPAPPPALVASLVEPNVELVHILERLLAMAVEGDLRALAYVTVAKGAVVGTGWFHGLPGENHRHNIGSGVAILAHRVAADSTDLIGVSS